MGRETFLNKQEKPEKLNINKKPERIKNLVVGITVLVIVVFSLIISLKDISNTYGVSLGTFSKYIEWLNEEVNETNIATNPIKSADITTFTTKANASGLEIYDANGNINFNLNYIGLNSTLELCDYEVGAMINEAAKSDANAQIYTLLELTIKAESDGTFSLKTVVKFNLEDIKTQIGKMAKDLPNNIYLTSIGQVYKVGTRIQTADNKIFINQLSTEKNDKIVEFLKMAQADLDNDINSIEDINNYMVAEILTKLAQKSETTPHLSDGKFSLIKE